jgi:polar amino acid transport system substrate-binding protein
MRSMRTVAQTLVPLVVIGLTVTACGSSSDSKGGGSSSSATTVTKTFFSSLPQRIQDSKVITFVGDAQSPLRMPDATNSAKITGVQQDFVEALQPLLGVTIQQPIVDSFASVKTGVESGRYDMAWGGLADSKAAETTLDIITWITANPTFVFAATNKFTKPEDLCGKHLAKLAGSVPLTDAFNALVTLCTSGGKTAPDSIDLAARADLQLAVQSGRVDAYGTTPYDGAYTVQQAPDKWKTFSVTAAPFVISNLGAAFKKGDTQLRDALYGAMQELWNNGTYAKIMKKWGLEAVMVSAPLLNAASNPVAPLGSNTPTVSSSASPSTTK